MSIFPWLFHHDKKKMKLIHVQNVEIFHGKFRPNVLVAEGLNHLKNMMNHVPMINKFKTTIYNLRQTSTTHKNLELSKIYSLVVYVS